MVIRSPWDYQDTPDEFLSVLEQIESSSANLQNPIDIVRWNLEKTYLRDLRDRGVPIVPTHWFDSLTEEILCETYQLFDVDEIIVKPVIGANADDAFRLPLNAASDAKEAALETFRFKPLMAQPFVPGILDSGEFSLF